MWDVGATAGVAAVVIGVPAAWFAWKSTAGDRRTASEQEWVDERARLNAARDSLSTTARQMHTAFDDQVESIGQTDMLTLRGWRTTPIPLADIETVWRDVPSINQAKLLRLTSSSLPLARTGNRYARYSDAMRALAKPRLFEDRLSYRLVGLTWNEGMRPSMEFAKCRYFDMLDISEPLAHEFAREVNSLRSPRKGHPSWRRLPLRSKLKNDLLGLNSRAVLPSIGTLLLRKTPDGEATFLLHRRDPAAVAIAGGHYSLIPAGVFQPASDSPAALLSDLDLWRSVARELDEELLGSAEAGGSGGVPIDYDYSEPYASFQKEIDAGRMKAWCLGLGIDPLTLTVELLTCLVVDASAYDALFAAIVKENEEGKVVAEGRNASGIVGFKFTRTGVEKLGEGSQLSPVAAATCALALKHRDLLLGS